MLKASIAVVASVLAAGLIATPIQAEPVSADVLAEVCVFQDPTADWDQKLPESILCSLVDGQDPVSGNPDGSVERSEITAPVSDGSSRSSFGGQVLTPLLKAAVWLPGRIGLLPLKRM